MEEFRDIPGYEGFYQVSNLGNVKSLKSCGNKYGSFNIQKISKNNSLYGRRGLWKNGKIKRFLTSRLVAQAFLGLDINDKKMLVCHKDDNPLNNIVDNLFLGTNKDNMQDAIRKGRKEYLFRKGINNPNSKQISQYSLNGYFIKKWGGIREINRKLGINIGNISLCCNGKRKTAGGFIWKFI